MTEHIPNLAVFVDYDNVAIGSRDANYGTFDTHLVLERLLEKGKIIVKKAYADWSRFESAKKGMHAAAFELIEIPKTSYSGKNSADIRLVVDALDLCYTKAHVDLVAIVSGDSDFSPLVSKLRENGKTVIGVGVKSSTSNLLVENCDEFIYYDDLVRQTRKATRGRRKPAAEGGKKTSAASKGDKQQEAAGSRHGDRRGTLPRSRGHRSGARMSNRSSSASSRTSASRTTASGASTTCSRPRATRVSSKSRRTSAQAATAFWSSAPRPRPDRSQRPAPRSTKTLRVPAFSSNCGYSPAGIRALTRGEPRGRHG